MAQTNAFEQKHSWGHLWLRLRLRHTLGRLLGCVAGGSCCSVMWPAGRFVWGLNFPFFGWWYMYLYLFICSYVYIHTYLYIYIYTCINENPPCFGPWPFWPKWSLAYGDHGSISQKITEDMEMIQPAETLLRLPILDPIESILKSSKIPKMDHHGSKIPKILNTDPVLSPSYQLSPAQDGTGLVSNPLNPRSGAWAYPWRFTLRQRPVEHIWTLPSPWRFSWFRSCDGDGDGDGFNAHNSFWDHNIWVWINTY